MPQVTVRNPSTKDNVGTLPLYSYTEPAPAPAPTPQPLTFMTLNSLETSNAPVLSTAVVLFQCQTTLVGKPSLVHSFFFIRIYFIRISRLKFAKF